MNLLTQTSTTTKPHPKSETGNPVLVEVTRGNEVESRHCGAIVIATADGAVTESWGDGDAMIFPRSSIKPLQAVPFVETGTADHFKATDAEIALACASHSGEDTHVDAVRAFMNRVGLKTDDLECGAHDPMGESAARALIQAGDKPTRLHNNCSGKHAAMLATAKYLREPTKGYTGYDHPVQIRVRDAVSDLIDFDLNQAPWGIDGCGIPVIQMPLKSIATGMARLADPASLDPIRRQSAKRIMAAIATQPYLIAGHDRFDTLAMEAGYGGFIIKVGAEGIYAAAIPELKLGFALKIDDGAKRAAEVAAAAVLKHLRVLDGQALRLLHHWFPGPIKNAEGEKVGEIRATL